ncbi:MAG: alcohol dehydrogenase catalytic domain-containing protein [Candidatus Aminicenantes bacterium]|nr:alcohol dehydrogenase catalytic domain-containing protein [Candidatus Aminicenantes bacterium]
MKAAILEEIEHLVVKELPDPQLEEGSVIIKVKVCSICGSDLRIYHHGHPRVKLPHILGHEIAGEIESVSEGKGSHKVNDRIALTPRITCGKCYYCREGHPIYCLNSQSFGYQLPGGYAEYVLVPRRGAELGLVNRIPDTISYEEATLSETLACCLRAQKESRVSSGNTVVIIGGGPVGIIHCRLAKANQARMVIIVERDSKRLSQVSLSAIDKIVESTTSEVEEEVLDLTKGVGADVVIVACSSASAQEQALSLAAKGGRINFFGGLPAHQSRIAIDSNLIHYREISIQGSHGSTPDDNKEALDMLAQRLLDVGDLITHTFPLEAIEKAFQFADTREGMHTSIVL